MLLYTSSSASVQRKSYFMPFGAYTKLFFGAKTVFPSGSTYSPSEFVRYRSISVGLPLSIQENLYRLFQYIFALFCTYTSNSFP